MPCRCGSGFHSAKRGALGARGGSRAAARPLPHPRCGWAPLPTASLLTSSSQRQRVQTSPRPPWQSPRPLLQEASKGPYTAPPPAPAAALASPLSNVHRITRLASLFFVTFMVVLLTGPLIYLLIYLFMPLRTPFLLQRKSAHLVLCGKDIYTF